MKKVSALHQLLARDAASKQLYDQLSLDSQVALQEQRQNISSYEELSKAVQAFEKRSRK